MDAARRTRASLWPAHAQSKRSPSRPLRGNLSKRLTAAEENGRSLGRGTRGSARCRTLERSRLSPFSAEPTDIGLYYGHDGWLELEVSRRRANPSMWTSDARDLSDLDGGYAKRLAGDVEMVSLCEPTFDRIRAAHARATIRMNRRLRHAEDVGGVVGEVKHSVSLAAKMAALWQWTCRREEKPKGFTPRVARRL